MPLLELSNQYLVLSNGLRISVIDVGNGSVDEEFVCTLPEFVGDKSKHTESTEVDIVIGSFSPSGRLFIVVDSFKRLFVIETNGWKIGNIFNVERRPTKVICEENLVLVSDGSGDVYHFDLEGKKSKLLMGHLSMILDMKLSPNKRFLATSDRDEKIRISNFPNSYNIHSFCLSHSEFVSSIAFVNDNLLLSGSGDGTLKLWTFMDGKLVYDYDCKKALETSKLDQEIAVKNILQLNQSTFSVSFYSSNCLLIVSISDQIIKTEKLLTFSGSTCYRQFTFKNFHVIVSDSSEKIITSLDFERGFMESNHSLPILDKEKVKSLLTESLKGLNSREEEIKILYKQWFNNVESYMKKKEERIKGTG